MHRKRHIILRFKFRRIYTTLKYLALFFLAIFIISNQSALIFRPSWHIPWLTNVQLVQPLKCSSSVDSSSWPGTTDTDNLSAVNDDKLTIIIVTARPEFKRLPLTLAALASHLYSKNVFQLIILTPSDDVSLLQPFVSDAQSSYWPWPLTILADDRLIKHVHVDSYRLQMMFKLVVAQIIKTEFYLILDSDCVAVRSIHVDELIRPNHQRFHRGKLESAFRALYQHEERRDHQEWWTQSEQILRIKTNSCLSNMLNSTTMGVTPIILSRTISLRTLCRLEQLYGQKHFLNKLANWSLWRLLFGQMWTEYTLYYLTGKCSGLFDLYHADDIDDNLKNSIELYGLSIWWKTDWMSYNREKLKDLIIDGLYIDRNSSNKIKLKLLWKKQLFTVLQGRQSINPREFHDLFYPFYYQYLREEKNNVKLTSILSKMESALLDL